MGYYAPDAEEVYDYIFRIGRHAPRNLCDGFGWSILFVNDSSPVCKDFLVRYGVELCYRTADRVRFVFFSGLTREETEDLLRTANSEWGSRQRVGFLPRIIEAIGRRWRSPHRFEFERDLWDELRPSAFYPLDSRDRIDRHLDMECEINSAMPGAEEALLLAQRLGIGRFVPCFLLFSDVGKPSVCLLPIADKSPEEVFHRLRGWIDTFYETNNPTLGRWAAIEESIQETCRALERTVSSLSQWRNERSKDWMALKRLAYHLNRLEATDFRIDLLEAIEQDGDLSWEIRSSVAVFRKQWAAIEEHIHHARSAMKWTEKLKSMRDPQTILEELRQFKRHESTRIPTPLRDAIKIAESSFDVPPPPRTPGECIADWWRSKYGRRLSRNQYDKHRSSWDEYSKKKHGSRTISSAVEYLAEEFEVVLNAAYAQKVDCESERAADNVALALANYLGTLPADSSWQQAISSYRAVLVDYFANLRSHAPPWLSQFTGKGAKALRWGDCIPTVDQLMRYGREQCLVHLPTLKAIVDRVTHDAMGATEEETRLNRQQVALAEVSRNVEKWLSEGDLLGTDKISICLAVVSALSGERKELEDKIFSRLRESRENSSPGRVLAPEEAADLATLLDEYDQAVDSVILPFEEDIHVLRLSLDTPLQRVSRGTRTGPASSPAAKEKARLQKAATEAEGVIEGWISARNEANEYCPGGRLYRALVDTLPASRVEELRPGLGSPEPLQAIYALTDRHQIVRILNSLHVRELLAVESNACSKSTPPGSAKPNNTKESIIDSILVAIGLTSSAQSIYDERSRADLLKQKARQHQFDVFLAHNSKDQADVMVLGEHLRRRGIYPWIDIEQVPPGRWFQDVLQSAIRTVKTAAIIIGTSGIGKWQALEIKTFVSHCVESSIPVIPVLLPGAGSIPEELIFLRELRQVAFQDDVKEDSAISDLIWGITGKRPEYS
jgi:hypothetical protein